MHDALDPQALGATLRHSLNPQAESTAMTVAEKLIEQGGVKGRQQGIQQGIQQGRTQTQRGILRRQLGRRFGALPEWAVGAIEEAEDARLEVWLDRVIDADTLDQVFAS